MPTSPQFQWASFKTWIQGLAGASVPVQWSTEPEPWDGASGLDDNGVPLAGVTMPTPAVSGAGGPCSIDLDVTSATGVGQSDERRRTYHPESAPGAGDDYQDVTQSGLRYATVTLKIECDFLPTSLDVGERLRTAMHMPSSIDALRKLGCALRSINELRVARIGARDNRFTDIAILELFLTFASNQVDPIGETEIVAGQPKTKNNYISSVGRFTFNKV